MKLLIIAIILVTCSHAHAQLVLGRPVMEIKFSDISGSPYLYAEWERGSVELNNTVVHSDLALKYNIYKEKLNYKDPKTGGFMEFEMPVKSFILDKDGEREYYKKGFPPTGNYNENTFYRVLYDGKVKLLYKLYKSLVEEQDYSSAVSKKQFTEYSSYYLVKNGLIEKIRPSKKAFLKVFEDKIEDIKIYQKNETIDYDNKQDLIKLVEFYSSL